jgi:2,4-dienoyl-CoA reductase-like NADH-dependent reductase (Old Yellow Enzyme family)
LLIGVSLKGSLGGITFAKPHAASSEEIQGFIDSFAHAAEFLDKAGFDGVQLHAAHGCENFPV